MRMDRENNMDARGIYLLLNEKNGMVYVGSTSVSFKRRLEQHEGLLRNHSHTNYNLQCAWDKYGAQMFKFVILEYIEDISILLDREQYWLNHYRTLTEVYNIKLDVLSRWCRSYNRTAESIAWQKEISKRYWANPRVVHRERLRAMRRGERWLRALREDRDYKHGIDSQWDYDCSTDEGYWAAICDEYQRWMDGELCH